LLPGRSIFGAHFGFNQLLDSKGLFMPLKTVFTLGLVALATSGCANVQKPYAQNPYNPNAKISKPVATPQQQAGKTSDSTAFRAANLGLAAASRPIPGAISSGSQIGIAAAQLLLGSGTAKSLVIADNANYLVVAMPLSEASDEIQAQIKMGAIVESAILKALQPQYQARIEEYDDHYAFGQTLRPRWLRVNGPHCENWSCQIIGPTANQNALQWEGKMEIKPVQGQSAYVYHRPFEQAIGFLTIQKEYIKDGWLAGSRKYVEATEPEKREAFWGRILVK
jgi:hypothetical protein